MLLGSRGGLLVVLVGSFWPIVLLFRSAVRPVRAARRHRLHLGDGQHGLRGRGRRLVQEMQVLVGRLLFLTYGRQLRLGEDVLGDGALGAAGGRAAAVVGPGLLKALLRVLLLRGVPLGWQWLQITTSRKRTINAKILYLALGTGLENLGGALQLS